MFCQYGNPFPKLFFYFILFLLSIFVNFCQNCENFRNLYKHSLQSILFSSMLNLTIYIKICRNMSYIICIIICYILIRM